ncbi:hypothetical protein ACA910_005014 [Epithemia clementina (nom. ined.)]
MFSRAASSAVLRTARHRTAQSTRHVVARRFGAGGDKYLYVDENLTMFSEGMGIVVWLWVFHRFRKDGDVLLGYRYPWEHPGGHHDHHEEGDHHH